MKKDKPPNFRKEDPVQLENGAIILPITLIKEGIICEKTADYMHKNRWGLCNEQGFCNKKAIKIKVRNKEIEGFSCELCPLRDKPENKINIWKTDEKIPLEDWEEE